MLNDKKRSLAEIDLAKLSLLAMATKHSIDEANINISQGVHHSIFDRCLELLKTLNKSENVPKQDRSLVTILIAYYQLALADTPEHKLRLTNGAMLDAFILVIGKTVERIAKSVQMEVNGFFDKEENSTEDQYHLTVVRFEFTKEVWNVAVVDADFNNATECFINDKPLKKMNDQQYWTFLLLKTIVTAMAVERANELKKSMARELPIVLEKAKQMADIMNVPLEDCLTIALECSYIHDNEDVGLPVTRGNLVQFIKMDLGCTLEQAYKAVQVWFSGDDEEIRA